MGFSAAEKNDLRSYRDKLLDARGELLCRVKDLSVACRYNLTCLLSSLSAVEACFMKTLSLYDSYVVRFAFYPDASKFDEFTLLEPDRITLDNYKLVIEQNFDTAKQCYADFCESNGIMHNVSMPHRFSASTPDNGKMYQSGSASSISTPRFNYAKRSLPTLADNPTPAEWLEWSDGWEKTVVPYFGEDLSGLARATKEHCGQKGKLEIAHIAAYLPDSFDQMWSALKRRFNNVTLNIYFVMGELSKVKKVPDSDAKALLQFSRLISSSYEQLSMLKAVDQVDYIKLNQIVSVLPSNYKEMWAEKFASLDPSDKLHPFEAFHDFICSKRDVVQAMYDMQIASNVSIDSSKGHNNKGKPRGQTFALSSDSGSCVLHPHGSHTLDSCREFSSLSPKERYDLCCTHSLCKKCLRSRHEGKCLMTLAPTAPLRKGRPLIVRLCASVSPP